MTTPCKLPFSVALGKREAMRSFTRFTTHPEELKEAPPAWRFTENQDLYLRFEAPMDFRFTMDGLDIVTLPGEDRYDGETWVRPRRAWDTLLFKGEDFPLVPGYYVLTVTGRGETFDLLCHPGRGGLQAERQSQLVVLLMYEGKPVYEIAKSGKAALAIENILDEIEEVL